MIRKTQFQFLFITIQHWIKPMPCIMINYFNCIIIVNRHFLTFNYDWVSFTIIYKKIIKILMTFLFFIIMKVNIKILIILILVTDFFSSCSMLNKGFLFPNISSSFILDWISQPKGTLLTSGTFKIKILILFKLIYEQF